MQIVPLWLRLVMLTGVAIAVVTIAALLLSGVWVYVAAGVGVFLVIAIGTPLALRPPSERQPRAAFVR